MISVVICTSGNLSRLYQKYLENIPGKHSSAELWKMAILGIVYILKKISTVAHYLISDMFAMNLLCDQP
jgi:hypothetical protein